MTTKPKREGTGTTLATVGAGLALVVCCALPLLLVAGGLGTLGAVLGNAWVIGAAVVVAVTGLLWMLRRHTTSSEDDQCCAPEHSHQSHARHSRQR